VSGASESSLSLPYAANESITLSVTE
jgi:hypothetical protein